LRNRVAEKILQKYCQSEDKGEMCDINEVVRGDEYEICL